LVLLVSLVPKLLLLANELAAVWELLHEHADGST
jgi:hypothetical protein